MTKAREERRQRVEIIGLAGRRTTFEFFVMAALLAASLSWSHLLLIGKPYLDAQKPNPEIRSNNSDLYPRWVGARSALIESRNPYSSAVTDEIQRGYYGSTVDGSEYDEQRFAYPAHFLVLFAPFAFAPFETIREWAPLVLALAAGASVPLWCAVGGHTGWRKVLLAEILVLGSWPVAEALAVQQLTLIFALILAAASALALQGRLLPAGILLACSTAKPQIGLPLALWWVVWSIFDWRNRKRLTIALIAAVALLIGISELIVPGWITDWYQSLPAYVGYTHSGWALQLIAGKGFGIVLTAVMGGLAGFVALRAAKTRGAETFGIAWVLATALAIAPNHAWGAYNEVLLIPAAVYLCGASPANHNSASSGIGLIAWVALAWGYIGSGLALLFHAFGRSAGSVPSRIVVDLPIYNTLVVPIAVMAALWVARPAAFPQSYSHRGRSAGNLSPNGN